MQELYDLEPAEVSLVTKGANKKKFIIFKSAGGAMPNAKEVIEMVRQADPEAMKNLEEVLKAMPGDYGGATEAGGVDSLMDPKVAMAMKAIARILLPFKDMITFDQICEVMQAIGISTESAANPDDENLDPEQEGEVLDDEDLDAEDDPTNDDIVTMDDDEEEEADEEIEKNDKVKEKVNKPSPESGKEDLVEKAAIIKADGSLDLSAVPEAVRPAVELIYKGQQDAVKKAADLESQLKVERDERVNKELNAKADGWKHLGLPREDVFKSLQEAHAVGKESYERVCKMFDASNTQIEKSALFKEIGSSHDGGKGAASWEAIEKAAMEVVAKSGEKISKAQAVEKFLDTAEGSRMYGEYKAQRPGGI